MKESILRSYYNIGDLLLLKYEIYSGNLIGIKKIGGKFFTLNNFPLKDECTVYTIVLAFDIRKNTFLGYPDIEIEI